jgi:hypothetical protein
MYDMEMLKIDTFEELRKGKLKSLIALLALWNSDII